ncbi:hypothetical protein H4R35_003907 [Dimargaris xerosporica]|nr:hypothetical protein H4R35_003907 [Dimargaris xerosporica]
MLSLEALWMQDVLESLVVNFVGLHGQIYDRVVMEVLVWRKYAKTWAYEVTEQYLKAVILQCQLCGQMLRALPTDCTFSIHIRLRPNLQEAKLKSATWIPFGTAEAAAEPVMRLIPIKSVHTPDFKFQLYAQEMAIKDKFPETAKSCV